MLVNTQAEFPVMSIQIPHQTFRFPKLCPSELHFFGRKVLISFVLTFVLYLSNSLAFHNYIFGLQLTKSYV